MSAGADAELGVARPTPIERTSRFITGPGWRIALKILISAGLLVWIFNRVRLSGPTIDIGSGSWGPILAVWLLQSTLPFVQAERWRLIAATLGARLPYGAAIQNVYIGQFFNQILPSSIGGDAVRVWKLYLLHVGARGAFERRSRPYRGAACRSDHPHPRLRPALPRRTRGAVSLVALRDDRRRRRRAAASPPGGPHSVPAAILRLPLVGVVRAMPSAARQLFSDPLCLLRTLLLSIVIHVGVAISLWMLAGNLGADAPLAAFLLLAPLITLLTTVPISIGGWGVREGAMITALSLANVPPSVALTVSVEFGLIMLVVGLPGGALMLFGSRPAPCPAEPR